ncbi:hypothetical protein BU17DRAFT_44052 [Hysterangium stoloniferum]|nr:hypothetical protein BU17DRAFT_44052 [Hysterangium stoloniferum]
MDHFLVESPISPDRRGAQFVSGRHGTTSPVSTIEEIPETEDIYRGDPPSPPRGSPPRQASPVPSSSPSSSGWSGLGLRRGALGAVLELAINRWARATSGSSTSSSASSLSSVYTRKPRFRRRRPSISTSVNTYSEDFVRARRAREIGRTLPREFTLFLPVALIDEENDNTRDIPLSSMRKNSRLFRASSLPLILQRLDAAIKRSDKLRQPVRFRSPSPGRALDTGATSHRGRYRIGLDVKGKSREAVPVKAPERAAHLEKSQPQPGWWLDVSSPSWSDMREIGKLLHLHPLTLEDILHQETREKVELFPRLGYYFVVFRALESDLTRAKATQLSLALDDRNTPVSDGTIGATNLYIVVFRDGICTFHFEDISDHTQRVQHRIVQLEETFCMSSDWIAHGILDSIVDQYFPLLKKIDQEVKGFDDLLLSIDGPVRDRRALLKPTLTVETPLREDTNETNDEKLISGDNIEKISGLGDKSVFKTAEYSGSRPFTLNYTRLIGKLAVFLTGQPAVKRDDLTSVMTPSPLMRMASARKLVTSLSRLLGTKSEVISQMRKHLGSNAAIGFGSSEQTLAVDVGIYLDDIQDHILNLHQSLAHYERMLSHSHPAYLSQLRVAMSQGKQDMDSALLIVTVISIGVLSTQVITGAFSMNLGKIPTNSHMAPAPLNVWIIIVVTVLLVMVAIVSVSRYWWLQAKRKYARNSRGY